MCGIFGAYNRTGDLQASVLEKAVRALAHRGPDDQGAEVIATNSGGQLGLVHTRLSIIDLSPLGHQPMHDPATGNWIVFNGEIYNFRELRGELESAGHQFHTHSDTEVILAAYRAWGDDSVLKLRGMFAFALWDVARQRLVLARDPMGIKPLYYCRDEKHFAFASEIRTLLQTNLVPRKLDPTGLLSYLAFGSVYEPWTIVEGVSSVPPGHVVTLENSELQSRKYWDALQFASAESQAQPSDSAIQSLPTLLREAVLSHLVSDVPVGVFLSGGIDSSALVAVMSQSGVRPTTFSLVFREEEFNEAAHSRQVAGRFKTDHHEVMVSESDALHALPEALRAMDQPTIDGINTWLISAKTRAAGIKVALTGLGADEMFAGYSNFRRVPRMESIVRRFGRLPRFARQPLADAMKLVAGKSDRNDKLAELAERSEVIVHPYFLARRLFGVRERSELFGEGSFGSGIASVELRLENMLRESVVETSTLDPINRISYLESCFYMRNTLLRDADFMSMSRALELRVPFLDRALVEACFRIPGKAKLLGDAPKGLLLKSLGVELPNEIVHRPKRGFTLPFERWLRAEMKPLVETMMRRNAESSGIDPHAAAQVWSRFLDGKTSWSRPWSLFVLQSWCEQNL